MKTIVPTKLAIALMIGLPFGIGLDTGSATIGFGIFLTGLTLGLVSAGLTWLVTEDDVVDEEPEMPATLEPAA